jgi:hypothetical protein
MTTEKYYPCRNPLPGLYSHRQKAMGFRFKDIHDKPVTKVVTPAKAGVQAVYKPLNPLDCPFHRNDKNGL